MTSASFRRQTSSDSFNDALRALEAIGTDTWTAIGHLFPTFPAMATTHGVRMLKKGSSGIP
jgi:hypothetical protein